MIWLLTGGDTFGIEVSINEILTDKNISPIILKDVSLIDFTNEALTGSFFDNEKTIIVYNLLNKVEKEKKEDELLNVVSKIDKKTLIVFVEDSIPKAKLKKMFTEKGNKLTIFGKPQNRDLISHLKKRAAELGAEISPLAAERMVGYVGPNYWQLEEELKKLVLYKRNDQIDEIIDVADIDELVNSGFEASIFELTDAISQRNSNRAIALLDSFLDSGANEIYILSMIARQFRNITMAKLEPNITESVLSKKAGIHPYVAKKSILQSKNFSNDEILDIYNRIIKADLSLKSSQNERQALQLIIIG